MAVEMGGRKTRWTVLGFNRYLWCETAQTAPRFGTAVFMTCHFSAQHPSYFSKIIPDTASLLSKANIETQHQNALPTRIPSFFISVKMSVRLYECPTLPFGRSFLT